MAAIVTGLLTADVKNIILPVVVADFLNKRGLEAFPVIHSSPEGNSALILERFAMLTPEFVSSFEGKQVVLIGERTSKDVPNGLSEAESFLSLTRESLTGTPDEQLCFITGITSKEAFQGTTYASVIKQLYDMNDMEISRSVAGGLLCVLLEEINGLSAKATKDDLGVANSLAQIAGVSNISTLAREFGFTLPS